MKKITIYVLLLLAIALATITRLYKLGEIPKGFYVDEAGQGYSAYSILTTGKDEFGKPYPIVFRSLTDFKTPVYIYLIVPLIKIFGLTPFTVRLPSFIFSILTIPVLFALITHLTRDKWLAAISAILLSISPWHILFGRTNFECNVALFFFLSGVLAFYKGLKRPVIFLLSSVLFAIAIPAYHSQRIITPIMVLLLGLRHINTIKQKTHIKYVLAGFLLAIVLLLPTLSIIKTPGFLARATGLNIFSHSRQMPDGFLFNYQGVFSPVINNSVFLSTREFLSLYFSYLSPRYMFILGDYGSRSSFPELSTFYLWQFPFYIYGLWFLFSKKIDQEFRFFLITTLLISPIPAAVTRDPYTTIRSLPLVIPQIVIIGLGITNFYTTMKNKYLRVGCITILIGLLIYSLLKLYSSVFLLNEYYRAKSWDYGWQQVVEAINKLDKGRPVVVDNARSDPDLILAFFMKYDPQKYIAENFEVSTNEYYTNLKRNTLKHIGNVVTRPINWRDDLIIDQYLVADELGISLEQIAEHKLFLISQITYPDGTPAYRIVQTNPSYELKKRKLFSPGK